MPFSKDLLIGSSGNQGAGEFYEYQITRSLRVPGDADNQSGLAFLSRTQPSGAAADGTKETVSFWFCTTRLKPKPRWCDNDTL